jgi:predicted transcriptional regulator
MSHARTQTRQAVAALLKGKTDAGNNVYEARVHPLGEGELPAILIYTKQEALEEQTISRPRTQQRQLELSIEAYVKTRGKIDVNTDALATAIEKEIASDPTLGGLVKDTVLESTETQFSDDGEQPIAWVVLTYSVLYAVKEDEPDILL